MSKSGFHVWTPDASRTSARPRVAANGTPAQAQPMPPVSSARGPVAPIRPSGDPADIRRLAQMSQNAPRIPWDEFKRDYFHWKAGEHVALIGPTGLGKTTMLLNVLPIHPFVTVFATKPRDKTMTSLVKYQGYVRYERWPNGLDPVQFPRRIIWPDATQLNSKKTQRIVFEDAFAKIYTEGGWTLALDETWYMDDILKLGEEIKTYLLQARSLDISLISAFQRPAWVPRELYSSSTHLMFWRTNDETDLKSLSGIGFRSAGLIRDVVSDLDLYQVLYINSRTGVMCRTRCPEVRY